MVADAALAGLRADARHRAPDPPGLDKVIEDAGRQRLAAYYLYSALLAGVIGTDDLASALWAQELAEPVHRLGLTRFALSGRDDGNGLNLELVKGWRVVGACPVRDHWELVGQHLAGAPLGGPPAEAGSIREPARTVARRLANHAIPDAVSPGVTLAVHLHPIGTIAGLDTRLIRSRIQAGRDQADAFHRLSQDLGTLRAQSDGELADRQTKRTST